MRAARLAREAKAKLAAPKEESKVEQIKEAAPAPSPAHVAPWKPKVHASGPYSEELIQTAKDICKAGKGILAADESTGTIGKRFE